MRTPSRFGPRYDSAVVAIDGANAGDPNTILARGERRPKEQVHAELMTEWVLRLDPDADELALLAARAHHLRRWTIPRADFPDGRAGYLRWRRDLKRFHAEEVATLLRSAGYDGAEVARVQAIIRKEGLGADPVVQVHEDALCLVFLETQFDDLIERLGEDRAAEVVRKTVGKMSPAGVAAAAGLPLSDRGASVLTRALGADR